MAVTELVERERVARTASKSDRRRTELRWTASGEPIVRSARRVLQMRIADLIARMSDSARGERVRRWRGSRRRSA